MAARISSLNENAPVLHCSRVIANCRLITRLKLIIDFQRSSQATIVLIFFFFLPIWDLGLRQV